MWDALIGKKLAKYILPEHNYDNFEVISNSIEQESLKKKVLLMSKFDIEDCKNETFFSKD